MKICHLHQCLGTTGSGWVTGRTKKPLKNQQSSKIYSGRYNLTRSNSIKVSELNQQLMGSSNKLRQSLYDLCLLLTAEQKENEPTGMYLENIALRRTMTSASRSVGLSFSSG